MFYAPITILTFAILSAIAVALYGRKKRKELERKLAMKWQAIQRDAASLYFILHHSIKDLSRHSISLAENPVMVDLAIDMEKLERPSDARRLYSIIVQLNEDISRLSSVLAEYRLYIRDDLPLLVGKLMKELEEFLVMESKLRGGKNG